MTNTLVLLAFQLFSLIFETSVRNGNDLLLHEARGKLDQGELDAAAPLLEQALAQYRKHTDREGEAVALKEMGNLHHYRGEYERALELQMQCLKIAREINSKDLQARALINLGRSQEALGHTERARENYQESKRLAGNDAAPEAERIAQVNIARLHVDQEEYAEAIAILEPLVPRARQAKDPHTEAPALVFLAQAYSALGRSPEAITRYEEALIPTRKVKNEAGEGSILQSLAFEHFKQKNLDLAKELARQSLEIGRKIKHQGLQEGAHRLLSLIDSSQGPSKLDSAEQMLAAARESSDRELEEVAVAHLARAFWGAGDLARAREHYHQLLALARDNKKPEHIIESLRFLGDLKSLEKDHTGAIDHYRELISIAQEHQDRKAQGSGLAALGGELLALGQRGEGIDALRQGLVIAREVKSKLEESIVLRKLGLALSSTDLLEGIALFEEGCALGEEVITEWERKDGKSYPELRQGLQRMAAEMTRLLEVIYRGAPTADSAPKLVQSLERLLAQVRRWEDREKESAILAVLASLSLAQRELDGAIDRASEALQPARESESDRALYQALDVLMNAYDQKQEFDRAILYGDELAALTDRHPDLRARAMVRSLLAALHSKKGDFVTAAEQEERAYRTAVEASFDELALVAAGSLASSYHHLGNVALENHWNEEALTIARRIGDRPAQAITLLQLGGSASLSGDYLQAIARCAESLQLAETGTELSALACLLRSTAALGDLDKAKEYARQTLAAVDRAQPSELKAGAFGAVGYYHFIRSEHTEAIKYFSHSAAVRRKLDLPYQTALAELDLGFIELLANQKQEALPHYERAAEILAAANDLPGSPLGHLIQNGFFSLLSTAYLTAGEKAKALILAETAWEEVQTNGQSTDRAVVLHNLGHALFASGSGETLKRAEEALRRAIAEWDAARTALGSGAQIEKASLIDSQTLTYELLQRVLIAQNLPEAALAAAEQARGRAFLEALASRQGQSGAVRRPTIDSLRRVARERNVTLVEYSILHDPADTLLVRRFESGESRSEKDLYLWVIKPTGEVLFTRKDLTGLAAQGHSLTSLARSFRSSVPGRGRGVAPALAASAGPLRWLHQWLIEPIAAHLPDDPEARVVFVPHGSLFLVPFVALEDASGRPLIHRHTVLTAPSIESVAAIRSSRFRADWKGQDVLVAGNPVIATTLRTPPLELQDLPGAQGEAEKVGEILGAVPLTGQAATREEILRRLPGRRLIHLASHGLLEDLGDRYVPGALVLAPSGQDGGLLTAREIFDLSLQADLAVLSACDTGGGRITGEGMIGLSRAFLSAGVPNVMVSLWQAQDEPTATLMKRFYRELLANPDPARALRQAMLAAIEDKAGWQSWAAFTLVGGLP